MRIEVTLNMLPDLLASAALIMLSIYHLMIYSGRKKDPEEGYNLYFSIFVFAATLFIIAPYLQPQYFFYSLKPSWLYVINIEAFLSLVLFISGLRFLNLLLRLPWRLKRYFIFTYVTMPLNVLLTLTSNFISLEFYFKNILPIVLLVTAINVILIYSLFGYWMVKENLYKLNFFRTIYFGFIFLTGNILFYRTYELLHIPQILIFNHYVSAVILFIFAYALSVKFNTEYFELRELKINLEQKVIDRTEDLRKSNVLLEERNAEIEYQKQEITSINKQLSLRAEELTHLDEAKSRFFAGISHEFRTPLTLIIGPLENFIADGKEEKVKTEYAMMLRQARRLLALINQLLELSKLQKGMMVLLADNEDVKRFVQIIVDSYSSLAKELDIQLSFRSEGPAVDFYFDKDKVEKIVTNLLTNALKFTEGGGKVEVVVTQPQNGEWVEMVVRDTGKGIEQDKLKNIFDPFYQVDPSRHPGFEGSGIGLALVKELVDLHQGTVHVSSQVEEGTVFTIRLPVLSSAMASSQEAGTEHDFAGEYSGDKTQPDKISILLVEDNDDMRLYIRSHLPPEYHLIEAVNGKEGFEKAAEFAPDLVIADIMMPVVSGLEMTRALKLDERISHIPVILLTAKASLESKIEGLDTQADDYVTKPFSMTELVLRIRNLIVNRKKLRAKFSKSITVVPSEIVTTSTDEKFLQKALQAVERNMGEPDFSAESFCEAVNMSRANVHRKLKALTDQSATEFIRSIRLKRAAQFLAKDSGSVSEIAYATGFNNLSYFTKCFKEEYGVLPSAYGAG